MANQRFGKLDVTYFPTDASAAFNIGGKTCVLNSSQMEELIKFLSSLNTPVIANIGLSTFSVPNRNKLSPTILKQYMEDIKRRGVLIPITVRRTGRKNHYELIDGSYRTIASRKLGYKTIPARILGKPYEVR
jgi:hypothetical protein